MSLANRLWGVPRNHGELLKVAIGVAQSTVAKYMARTRRGWSQTWKTFLHNHAAGIAAMDWNEAPDYTIQDRDGAYGHAVTKRLSAMGIRVHPTAPRSPWQNGHAERLIGSIRRECLNHIIVFGEAHLHRILAAYVIYYNAARTHLALGKDAPIHRTIQRFGQITTRPTLGGLHHEYCRT